MEYWYLGKNCNLVHLVNLLQEIQSHHPLTMQSSHLSFQECQAYADFTLRLRDNSLLKVSKVILAMRSSYFHHSFSQLAENETSMDFVHYPADVTRMVIQHLYGLDVDYSGYDDKFQIKLDVMLCKNFFDTDIIKECNELMEFTENLTVFIDALIEKSIIKNHTILHALRRKIAFLGKDKYNKFIGSLTEKAKEKLFAPTPFSHKIVGNTLYFFDMNGEKIGKYVSHVEDPVFSDFVCHPTNTVHFIHQIPSTNHQHAVVFDPYSRTILSYTYCLYPKLFCCNGKYAACYDCGRINAYNIQSQSRMFVNEFSVSSLEYIMQGNFEMKLSSDSVLSINYASKQFEWDFIGGNLTRTEDDLMIPTDNGTITHHGDCIYYSNDGIETTFGPDRKYRNIKELHYQDTGNDKFVILAFTDTCVIQIDLSDPFTKHQIYENVLIEADCAYMRFPNRLRIVYEDQANNIVINLWDRTVAPSPN